MTLLSRQSGSGDALLVARHLSKVYRQPRRFRPGRDFYVTALQDVSLAIPPGGRIALVGESGSGKSTLALCLAGFEIPDEGEIWLEHRNLLRLTPREWRAHRRRIQLVLQDAASALNPCLSAMDIVEEPLLIAGIRRKERREQVRALFDQVGLPPRLEFLRPPQLSGGQRQRLAIARALAASPNVLILDEAFSGLDLPIQRQLIDLLAELQLRLPVACVFITHDLRLAASVAREIVVMHQGQVVEQAGCLELFLNPQHSQTRALIRAIPEFAGK